MSRRQPIPGVDEAALAGLAEQFPSGMLRTPVQLTRGKTPAQQDKAQLPQDNAPAARDIKEVGGLGSAPSAAPDVSRRKIPGRGLAVWALMLALLAVLIAVSAVMPPPARSWLTRTLGDTGFVNFITGNRADIDKRLAAASLSIDALAGKETEIAARLEAIETVVGSGAAMRRLDAVEAGLRAADQRLAAAGDAERMAAARVEALGARLATFDGDLKTVQDKLAAAERDVGDVLTARLGAVQADIGELQKIDRRPEKFFLAALQLRDMTRTANPFAREAAAARALAGPGNSDLLAALKVLAADAARGVPTVAELRHDFTALVAPRLASVAAANRQTVAGQAWGWVKSQFTTAGAAGDRNATVIALAVRNLDEGQLEAALQQLLLLEDEAALVAAEWLQNASIRLATDKAIATVMSQAVDQLATPN
jgi:hypothetical protein